MRTFLPIIGLLINGMVAMQSAVELNSSIKQQLENRLSQSGACTTGNPACSDLLYIDLYNILFSDFIERILDYLACNTIKVGDLKVKGDLCVDGDIKASGDIKTCGNICITDLDNALFFDDKWRLGNEFYMGDNYFVIRDRD